MKKLIVGLVLLTFLVSCKIKQVAFEGTEGFKMEKFENNTASFQVNVKIKNDNWFKLKVKPSHFDVSVDDTKIGTLYLKNKLKIKGKESGVYTANLKMELESGAAFSMMKYLGKRQLNLHLVGAVKGGVFIFSKKVKIDQNQTIDASKLNLNIFKN